MPTSRELFCRNSIHFVSKLELLISLIMAGISPMRMNLRRRRRHLLNIHHLWSFTWKTLNVLYSVLSKSCQVTVVALTYSLLLCSRTWAFWMTRAMTRCRIVSSWSHKFHYWCFFGVVWCHAQCSHRRLLTLLSLPVMVMVFLLRTIIEYCRAS